MHQLIRQWHRGHLLQAGEQRADGEERGGHLLTGRQGNKGGEGEGRGGQFILRGHALMGESFV